MTQKNTFFKFTTKLVQENQIEIKIISDPFHIWEMYMRSIYAIVAKRTVEWYGELDMGFRIEGIVISKPEGINVSFMGPEMERIMAKAIEQIACSSIPEFKSKRIMMTTSSSGSTTVLSTLDNI